MDNRDVARCLDEIAQLLELKGESAFKVRAYQNAARGIEALKEPVAARALAGGLESLPGIGKAIAEKIGELCRTGELGYLAELRREIPAGLVELLRLPGMGPKKAKKLYDELGVCNLADLEAACREGKLAGLRGFGVKTEQKLLEAVGRLASQHGRFLLRDAIHVGEAMVAHLRKGGFTGPLRVAGSVRRYRETIGDVDLLAAAEGPEAHEVAERFAGYVGVVEVLARGPTKTSVRLSDGVQVDLRVVPPRAFAAALHHFTGSKEHHVKLRGLALKRGYSISEYGLERVEDGTRVEVESEEHLYALLGLPFIPPELREDQGEIEAALAGTLPELLPRTGVRGVFHVHTDWSDGTASLVEMARAARDLGLEYVGISDHSQAARYAGGLDAARLRKQADVVAEARAVLGDAIRIFHGVEVDILPDGELDLDPETLGRLDFVIASVHAQLELPREQMTARIVRAIRHPLVTMLGHPTQRLLLGRPGYAVDLDVVAREAAAAGVALEINAHHKRLDLDWQVVRRLREASPGLRFAINPDAHSIEGLGDYRLGVGIARKAWVSPAEVVNGLPVGEMERYLVERRSRARGLLRA